MLIMNKQTEGHLKRHLHSTVHLKIIIIHEIGKDFIGKCYFRHNRWIKGKNVNDQ